METIKGYVDHIIYRNKENGYTVFVLCTDDEDITCVGHFDSMDEGEMLQVKGQFVEHAIYGSQLKIEEYEWQEPQDIVSVERYLGSGAIKGIGAALAKRIIKGFGEDTFRIMEQEPERLSEIKGISEKKAREIGIQVEEKKDMRQAMIFLQKYGISNALALRIYETYGMELYGILKENPYKMAEDVKGVGFKIADEIASKIGIHTDSDYRIRSGMLYVLLQGMQEGHMYLPKNLFLQRVSELLEIDKNAIEPQLANLMMDKKIVIKKDEEDIIYSMNAYYAELNCARLLHELNISMVDETEKEQVLLKIKRIEENLELELDDLQRRAVLEAAKSGIFILSGGPGTGKTTTINTMLKYFESEGMDLYLAAPTGRAAKRMTEATGYEAKTIHRLLELNGTLSEEGNHAGFERNELHPLETDVVIIDEMSMVDIHLFLALLKAVTAGTRLILVGDVNQLPSVGPGQVLRDLIDSQSFPVVVLEKIFRQAGESDIVVNAHLINAGKQITLDNKSKDFFFLERNDINVIYKHMIVLINEKMPSYVKASPMDIQVLTPMRKGPLGVESLNKILQKYLNPAHKSKGEYQFGETLYRKGDKVMQTKNNYQLEWEIVSKYGIPIDKGLGVFNGDMGRICEINDYASTLVVEYDEHRRVTYPFAQIDELELAYAITIHKSQGSEYEAVIMPILAGPRMLFNRNLLYTGVTRAKSCVTILGSRETVYTMIANENEQKRYSGLKVRITEHLERLF